jgi:hypothetical protein
VTAELASNFRSAIEQAGITLFVDCPPLPQPVHTDRDMWEKIVLNLLSNAFKFTFEGEIAVRLSARSGNAVLTVSDTGVGVPAEELPRLFERFHRIEGQKGRTHEGSGIGHALVQELVKLHGGEIRAESRPGEGITLTVSIPFGTSHLPSERIGEQTELAPTSIRPQTFVDEAIRWLMGTGEEIPAGGDTRDVGAEHEPGRILVADDNADMRAYIKRLLDQRWNVDAVPNGKAALEAVRQSRPDLILTDVVMPGDGPGEEASSEGLAAGADGAGPSVSFQRNRNLVLSTSSIAKSPPRGPRHRRGRPTGAHNPAALPVGTTARSPRQP